MQLFVILIFILFVCVLSNICFLEIDLIHLKLLTMAEEKKKEEKKKEEDDSIEFMDVLSKKDKEEMKRELNLIALRIPCQNIGKLGQSLKPYTFQRKGIKPFQPDPENVIDSNTNKPKFKCLLLNESIKTLKLETIPLNIIELINECDGKPINYLLILDYDKLSSFEVLSKIIHGENNKIEIPTHYELVGHIVHFNLRDNLLKYKYLIGQVFLDKLPNSIKTIINKTGSISNEFRVFPMEIIGGKNEFETNVKENGCKYFFNFSRVYWNSRLGTEHERIYNLFNKNDIICDMMSGVGPFCIPSAKYKNCIIYANDLNPDSFKYLKQNCKINNVEKNINCFNLDARQFWKKLCKNKKDIVEQNNNHNNNKNKFIDHIIMNLPAIALEFCNVFKNCFYLKEIELYGLPMIHCYCFAPDINHESSINERLNKYLGCIPNKENLKIRLVRNVAPHKDMYCVSFRLPKQIALQKEEENSNNEKKHKLDSQSQPPLKRRKIHE